MSCQQIIERLGFDCKDLGGGTLRVWSPFTFGEDGEAVGVYVEPQGAGYRVSDYAEALMHASAMGVNITEKRLQAVRATAGPSVHISGGGAISASVSAEDLPIGVTAVLNAAMAVGHFESVWRPRVRPEVFAQMVGDVLRQEAGEALIRNAHVVGSSGHQLQLPFALRNAGQITYIQPVASEQEDVEWSGVYGAFGKMMDLKNLEAPGVGRAVVLQECANDAELGRAVTLLSGSAAVVKFEALRDWVRQQLRAA